MADWEREQEQCAKCGRPRSVCGDPDVVWYPQRSICYAEMASAAASYMYDQLHSDESGMRFHDGSFKTWAPKQSAAFPFSANDGVSIWMSTVDLSPDDHFLGKPEPETDEAVT